MILWNLTNKTILKILVAECGFLTWLSLHMQCNVSSVTESECSVSGRHRWDSRLRGLNLLINGIAQLFWKSGLKWVLNLPMRAKVAFLEIRPLKLYIQSRQNYYHRWYQTLFEIYWQWKGLVDLWNSSLKTSIVPLKGFKEANCSKLPQSIDNKEPCVALLIASGEHSRGLWTVPLHFCVLGLRRC